MRTAMAIATYERTLLANETPWDAILGGANASDVLTPLETQGALLFVSPPGETCDECHGPNIIFLSDDDYHYIGVRPQLEDPGRFAVTGVGSDRGAMKTPAMRNVELRAPYFHNGGMDTLEEVIEFYDRGGDFDAGNLAIEPLGLTDDQKAALAAFLKRPLTDPRVAAGLPPFDRPSQYADSSHVPEQHGQGLAGTGGHVPEVIAVEPPKVGNPNLTLAVANALAGAPAVLLGSKSLNGPGFPLGGPALSLVQPQRLFVIPALMGTGPGGGYGSVVLTAPTNSSAVGTSIYLQWLVLDPGGPTGFAATPVVQMTWY